ncbi:alpha-amylase family protein [Microlunatus soli]|uniref:Alpha-galactosidase n=1 Tax=Microlunatus soli TaxID=630515 RepID=A0A1H1W8R9_9ACTN|nr:hypothetical protein [Microlunatus soli]SDS93362.1 hypothetical protein SAMN04489812_3535 [Microlunatus soli]
MQLRYDPDLREIRAATYRLRLDGNRPRAELFDPEGRSWGRLNLIASAHPLDGRDTAYPTSGPVVTSATDGRVEIVQELHSSTWQSARVRLDCRPDHLAITFMISPDRPRALDRVTMLGGEAVLPSGATGAFRSGIGFETTFVPAPTEPVSFTRPAAVPATISVTGDADPGRLHGIYSPGPFCYAFGLRTEEDPVTADGWLGCWLRAGIDDCTFTELGYRPLDGGYLLELDYQGHTVIDGGWQLTVVLRPTAGPATALADYREDLRRHGLTPPVLSAPETRPDWWQQPIFCGWGAQCAAAAGSDLAAAELSRQDHYDRWLDRLAGTGIVPGTIVLDDRWQLEYGTAEPDPDRWPDLRGWIADRHAAGQRVLLWWKAWDPTGLPVDECITDQSGRPVAVDPGNPRYRHRLTMIIRRLLAADGLDADGFKIDFTQRTPSGTGMHGTGPWGVAGLHRLLATLADAAKNSKPDALIITHTVNPLFADVTDMIRLNDITERDPGGVPVPVPQQMRMRQLIARSVLPDLPIDTDQWPMPNLEQWLDYTALQPDLGVPALYYTDLIDNSGEPIGDDHLRLVADSWRRYREVIG